MTDLCLTTDFFEYADSVWRVNDITWVRSSTLLLLSTSSKIKHLIIHI